ncbi:SDR family oxidoreductase [Halopseudomonas sp. SMJS2]|uniref:SDR family oxidoreductase n=1 Tax=Halopseudomonas sp. SMJS2 TaxID=3041098 RepID=UPI002452C386|nr:SDR family oxidoreductase [Halopseudomonas sp. SMJS2]WGK62458.1 SDR family oxidoreductase [Halopseudomonas sp. SMJS2]
MRLKNKVALITGGASGLGKVDAQLFVAEGAKVIITDVNDEAGMALAEELGCRYVHHDVSREEDWQRVMGIVTAEFGGLDVLVNNAGIVQVADIESTSLALYQRMNAVHNDGTFLGCRYAIEAMRERGGSIINMSSLSAIRGYPLVPSYAAAKGAVLALSHTVAVHCREKGYPIRCNSVLPGPIATPLALTVIEDASGMGQPEDVAKMVLFLASDDSLHVSGAEFVIDNAGSMVGGAV